MISLIQHSLISSAQRSPETIASRCADQQITYGQLEEATNQLANLLINEGVQKGDRIGVFMPRCVETMVAVYGILKSGGIFVPVDPNLSAGGVATLVNDCEIRHLLTHSKKASVINRLVERETSLECLIGLNESEERARVKCVEWDSIWDQAKAVPKSILIRPDDPAYIMYSSGSTGRPKGITHTHFSGLSYSRLSIETYQLQSSDIVANHSPISFDMSTFGYFTSCLAGATTVLIPEAHTKFPSSLAKLIEKERITIWYSVPLALIQLLLRTELDSFDMSSIRWVKFGGEPFPTKYLQAMMRAWPHARFSNVYGPAEVNQCTYYHVPAEYADDPNGSPIPIGQIWNSTDGMIVDSDDEPVVRGEMGELVVDSPTMMQCYWGRPERTANSFLNCQRANGESRRYYRTGDLVQELDDGNLLFLGRKDRQVKIRGYRIELDEVEDALSRLEVVVEAGVYCVRQMDEKQICASVICKPEHNIDSDQIRALLADTLSPYAIPNQIQIVQTLPRTVSGKIDRKQLSEEAEGVTQQ